MSYYKFIIFFSVISANFVIYYALKEESIVGGFEADQQTFHYHVAILGKENYSDIDNLICNGAILDDYFVLSAAQCFVNSNNQLKPLSFSIIAGVIDLNSAGVMIEVDTMYLSIYNRNNALNDIAVIKLKSSLFLGYTPNLVKISVPNISESLRERIGIVSGFGYNWIITKIDRLTGVKKRFYGETDYKLKFAIVHVVDDFRCNYTYPNFDPRKQFCGVMKVDKAGQSWGICTLDGGAPLVIDGNLVGIASRNSIDCDDTSMGCLYTDVAYFKLFIVLVMNESPSIEDYAYRNRPHIIGKLI